MSEFPNQSPTAPSPVREDVKDQRAPNGRFNLDNAFIHIDGQRYNLVDLLKSLMEKPKESAP